MEIEYSLSVLNICFSLWNSSITIWVSYWPSTHRIFDKFIYKTISLSRFWVEFPVFYCQAHPSPCPSLADFRTTFTPPQRQSPARPPGIVSKLLASKLNFCMQASEMARLWNTKICLLLPSPYLFLKLTSINCNVPLCYDKVVAKSRPSHGQIMTKSWQSHYQVMAKSLPNHGEGMDNIETDKFDPSF